MSWLDLVILVIIVLSALISLVRGFVKESISLVTWIVAGLLALRYFSAMAELLQPFVEAPMIRDVAGFSIIFIFALVVGAIVNFIMSQLVSKTGLSGTDKALGVVFGGARGVLIVTMVVLLASLTPMPEASWWQDSASVGFFQQLAEWLKGIIPADAADKFSF
jgi:membrane protein required for colicin V production